MTIVTANSGPDCHHFGSMKSSGRHCFRGMTSDARGRVGQEALELLGPPQERDEIGRLGGYRVLSVIGVGGMGVVFQAEDPQLNRPIAVKAMKPVIAASKSAKERFLREARATTN